MRALLRLVLVALIVLPMVAGAQSRSASKVVLGSLGQAMAKTAIYASPTTRARVYYRVPAFDYLVIKPHGTRWVRVLMSNGAYGFAPKAQVAQLPYEVTANNQRARGHAPVVGARTGSALANYSMTYIGTPYKWGGNDPSKGIDCSAFVKNVFGTIGVSLPRTAAEQALVGTPINRLENLVAGDRLYFWENRRNKIGHTGIYLGNGYFVHSSSGRGGVATDYLGDPKWRNILVAARR